MSFQDIGQIQLLSRTVQPHFYFDYENPSFWSACGTRLYGKDLTLIFLMIYETTFLYFVSL